MDQNNNIVAIYLDDSDGHHKCKLCDDIISEESFFYNQIHLCRAMIEDFEIRKTKDGRTFAIKNIRQEFEGKTVTYKADISGDLEAGNEYLKSMAEGISKSLDVKQFQENVKQ